MGVDAKRFVILGQAKVASWSHLTAVRMHNLREMEVTNVPEGAPPPVVVVGQRDLVAGVKAKLDEMAIRPRKGAVVALELVATTSPEWLAEDEGERRRQTDDVELRFRAYLVMRFGERCIVAVLRHEDETTVHWHAVVVPARRRVDGRFADGASRWALSARELVGNREAMQDEQTRFAACFADLGLVRGKIASGTRRVPNVEHQAMLNAQFVAIGVEREGMQRERASFAARATGIADQEAAAAGARAEAEADRAEAARALDEARAARETAAREAEAVRAAGERMAEREAAFEAKRVAANAWREKLIVRAKAFETERDECQRAMKALAEIEADALAVRRALALIGVDDARTVELRKLMARLRISTERASRDPGFVRTLAEARALAA